MPVARRGWSGTTAHLPAGLRYRLHHMVRMMGPDMGQIESNYRSWIDLYDRIDAVRRRAIMADIARMPDPPLISVVMPVFNPSPEHLLAAINSVQDQLYPWWELCIGDDASTDAAIAGILFEATERDHRIKLVRREENGHISAASNSALSLATGPFVALLDHDDMLPPHALHEVAARIVAQPGLDIIYSDEDHIDDGGNRSHPYFKPDWNPELMLGQNLISHFGVYRRSLIERIGGFRAGFEGSQDYDLALRMVAETQADRIAHIPRVLYHWRQNGSDRTFSEGSHDRCVENGRRAVVEFVRKSEQGARVEPAPLASVWTRVVYPVPVPAPLVSVIVSGPCSADVLVACIEGLVHRTDYPSLEILIPVDDAEEVGLHELLAQRVRCDRDFSEINEAVQAAQGSLVLMLDPHLEPQNAGWLREMVSHAVRPGVGAVGAKLLSPAGTVQHAGIVVGGRDIAFMPFAGRQRTQAGYFGHLQLARDVTAVSSACMMVNRQAFLCSGGRDQALSFAAFGDVDLCLKFSGLGYRTIWTPYAELAIREGTRWESPQAPDCETEADLMRRRWGNALNADRYWSPDLSVESAEAVLAFPPRTRKPTGQSDRRAKANDRFDLVNS
jgi:GT2 family glycosyltransferase